MRLLQTARRFITPKPNIRYTDQLPLRPDDVFLASYPRSGNTWVRNILAYMLYPPERITSLADLDVLLPSVHGHFDEGFDYSKPRIVKTHYPYGLRHNGKDHRLYHKVIYIVRHPFDVIPSYYHYNTALMRGEYADLADFVHQVVAGAVFPGSWEEHVLSWTVRKNHSHVLAIRYEDLKHNPIDHIEQIAAFLGISLSPAQVEQVNQRSSRKAMIALEEKQSLVTQHYEFIRRDEQHPRVPQPLSPELRQLIVEHSQRAMQRFDYADRECEQ